MRREDADSGQADAATSAALRLIAGAPANCYITEKLLAPLGCSDIETAVADLSIDKNSFRAVLSRYAFPRSDGCADVALQALEQTLEGSDFIEFLESEDSEALWLSFVELCGDAELKVKEQEQRPLLDGFARFNMDVYHQTGESNLFIWFADEVEQTGRIDHLFERLVEIRGLGPKNASHILRDAAFLFDWEDKVHLADRLFLQPITSSLRHLAVQIIPECDERPADWVLAGKVAKYCRLADVSGVRFNMGAAYLGMPENKGMHNTIMKTLGSKGQPNSIEG